MSMSDDELDQIKKKQLDDLLKYQQEQTAMQGLVLANPPYQ